MTAKEMLEDVMKTVSILEVEQQKRLSLIKQIDNDRAEIEKIHKERKVYEEASALILKFMEACRNRSRSVFEEIGTTALSSVFGEGFELSIAYSDAYKSSSADIEILAPTKNGEKITVELERCGGGMVDLVSMVFCISQLELLHPKLEGPILSDEYFKFLSDDLRGPAAEVLKETLNPDGKGADGKGRQLIMITHAKEFLEYADKIFLFKNLSGRSTVEDVTGRYIDALDNLEQPLEKDDQ